MERRDRSTILYEILKKVSAPVGKTFIMYSCNLSHEQLENYLNNAKKANLLRKRKRKNRTVYTSTEKGELFCKNFELQRTLQSKVHGEDPYSNFSPWMKGLYYRFKDIVKCIRVEERILSGRQRTEYSIMREILEIAESGSPPTRIIFKTYISWRMFKEKIEKLKDANLLEEKESLEKFRGKKERRSRIFLTTEKGRLFIVSNDLERKLMNTGGDNDPFKDSIDTLHEILNFLLSPLRLGVEGKAEIREEIKSRMHG